MPTDQDEIEKIAALALAPLVEVAWADGHVTPAEREGVLEAARALGLGQRSEFCRSTLRRWLSEAPPTEALEEWRRQLAPALAESTSRPARKARNRLLSEAVKVAKMDGLDFEQGPAVNARAGITEDEQRVLDELATALEGIEESS
jgi:tellurite resistance protein